MVNSGLVWRCVGDEENPPCDACKALDGRRDGDGWSSELGSEDDLWTKKDDGSWERPDTGGLVGGPPLHPNCRCKIVQSFAESITK